MSLGLGVDALDISRFEYYLIHIPKFSDRAFSDRERCLSHRQLAGNFSAKEAFIKACPRNILATVSSVEFLRDETGKPISVVWNENGKPIQSLKVHVSLTNLNNLVISTVLIETLNEEKPASET